MAHIRTHRYNLELMRLIYKTIEYGQNKCHTELICEYVHPLDLIADIVEKSEVHYHRLNKVMHNKNLGDVVKRIKTMDLEHHLQFHVNHYIRKILNKYQQQEADKYARKRNH